MDSPLDFMTGPGVDQWDMNVFKNIQVGEKGPRIQLRLEAYNAFNHTAVGFVQLGGSVQYRGRQSAQQTVGEQPIRIRRFEFHPGQ